MAARIGFRSARALRRLLDEQPWPDAVASSGVGVWLGQPGITPAGMSPSNESVVVFPAFRARRDVEAVSADGFQLAEMFELTLSITTRIPGRTESQVWDRLEALAEVIEDVVAGSVKHADIPVEVAGIHAWQWWTLNERAVVVPVDNGGGGWAGSMLIDVRVTGRA